MVPYSKLKGEDKRVFLLFCMNSYSTAFEVVKKSSPNWEKGKATSNQHKLTNWKLEWPAYRMRSLYTEMENARSNKGTPIAGARSPLGTINSSTPVSKRLYNSTSKKTLSKEIVEASDEGRASVDKLSQWLANESSKKQQHAVRSKASSSNAATPVRFRTTPRLKKEEVQATDDKRVSVKTLSSWMSDDPFERKKVRHIRSGAKVIAKSRIFEPTQSKNIDINIAAGCVQNKQAWLQEAFKAETNNVAKRLLPSPSEVRPNQIKKMKESPEKDFQSVKDKKEWLSNAFKHNDSNNNGDIQSKSVDSGESMNVSNAETAVLKSASVDDDVMLCSKDTQQQPSCAAEESAENCDNATHLDEDKHETVVSVADRAKWLNDAFNKK